MAENQTSARANVRHSAASRCGLYRFGTKISYVPIEASLAETAVRQAKLARSSRWKSGAGKGVASCLVASVARAVGDGGREAYTAIERGGLLIHEIRVAEAEIVAVVEGNMSVPAKRGAAALPRSKTPSRSKGSRRNLGDLTSDRRRCALAARIGKARSRSQ